LLLEYGREAAKFTGKFVKEKTTARSRGQRILIARSLNIRYR